MRALISLVLVCLPLAAAAQTAGDPPVSPAPADDPAAPAPAPAADPAPAAVPAAPAAAPPAPAAPPATKAITIEPEKVGMAMSGDEMMVGGGSSSPRSLAENWLLLPKGDIEVGGDLGFLTSTASARPIAFSDIGLLSLRGRYSLGRLELGASSTLLIKQPGYLDEPVLQAAALDARLALGTRHAAMVSLSGGPLMSGLGQWGEADLGLQARRIMHETLVFEGGVGGSVTDLLLHGRNRAFWFGEVTAAAQAIIRAPNGMAAMFVGSDLHVPVAWRPRAANPDSGTGEFLDPQTRLGFTLGGVYSVVPNWDLMVTYQVIDRGESDQPATQLPILVGGFDARVLMFTVVHRFEKKAHGGGPYYMVE